MKNNLQAFIDEARYRIVSFFKWLHLFMPFKFSWRSKVLTKAIRSTRYKQWRHGWKPVVIKVVNTEVSEHDWMGVE